MKFQSARPCAAGGVGRMRRLAPPGGERDRDDQHGDQLRSVLAWRSACRRSCRGGSRETSRPRPGRCRAADSSGAEKIGQDRVFERPEKRRLDPHREQQRQQSPGMRRAAPPAPPTSITTISTNLMMRVSRALSIVSASIPAVAEHRKNGRMNSPPASGITIPATNPRPPRADRRASAPARSSARCR